MSSAAFTDSTTISLIDAMMPTIRNGSATSSRWVNVVRTADRSSMTMNTSSSVSNTSTIGPDPKSSTTSRSWSAATTSSTPALTKSRSAIPR